MAGYDWTAGKSNNAMAAEEGGLMTATQLAKQLRCKSRAIAELLQPTEWHHTSGCYNRTSYYAEPALLAAVGSDLIDGDELDDLSDDDLDQARQTLADLRAWGKARIGGSWSGCTVEWLEWSGKPGSRSRRNRPRAEERREEGCMVAWKGGAMIDITTAAGRSFRKKITTRGLQVTLASGVQLLAAGCGSPEERLEELAHAN